MPCVPCEHWLCPAETSDKEEDPKPKRARIDPPEKLEKGNKREHSQVSADVVQDPKLVAVMRQLQTSLPKSGSQIWNGPDHEIVKQIQACLLDFQIQSIMASKGRDRYIVHQDNLPIGTPL